MESLTQECGFKFDAFERIDSFIARARKARSVVMPARSRNKTLDDDAVRRVAHRRRRRRETSSRPHK